MYTGAIKRLRHLILVFFLALPQAQAQEIPNLLSEAELKKLTNFFGSLSFFHQLKGPSEMAKDWGIDVAFQLSAIQSKKFNQVLEDNSISTIGTPLFPFALPVLRGSGPLGLNGAFSFIPKLGGPTFKIGVIAIWLRWSYGYYFELPFTADIRVHYSSLDVKTETKTQNVKQDVGIDIASMGISASVGREWEVWGMNLEPYVSVGWFMNHGDWSANVAVSDFFLDLSQKQKFYLHNVQLTGGVEMTIGYFIMAIEYSLLTTQQKIALSLGGSIEF